MGQSEGNSDLWNVHRKQNARRVQTAQGVNMPTPAWCPWIFPSLFKHNHSTHFPGKAPASGLLAFIIKYVHAASDFYLHVLTADRRSCGVCTFHCRQHWRCMAYTELDIKDGCEMVGRWRATEAGECKSHRGTKKTTPSCFSCPGHRPLLVKIAQRG